MAETVKETKSTPRCRRKLPKAIGEMIKVSSMLKVPGGTSPIMSHSSYREVPNMSGADSEIQRDADADPVSITFLEMDQ